MFTVLSAIGWRGINLERDPGVYMARGAGSLLILIATLIAASILANRARRFAQRASVGPNHAVLLSRATRTLVWFLGVLWILAVFQVPFTALATVVGATALALSLSLQDLLKNLIAGVYMLVERPFRIGDRINVAGVTGVIDDIQMRVTYLHDDNGSQIVMPNQTVFTQVIVNTSAVGSRSECISVDIPRKGDLDANLGKARELLSSLGLSARIQASKMSPDSATYLVTFEPIDRASASDALVMLGKALPDATITVQAGPLG
jgi:small-conductance mechanosensitive channel